MKTRNKKIETVTGIVVSVRRSLFIGVAVLLMGVFSLPANAQCEAKNDAFKSGEQVMYELYFNWKFVWVKAGIASLTTFSTTYHDQPAYRINLMALSSKRADMFFRMRDTLTCVIGEKLEPRYFRKGAEEGKRYTVDEAWFSYKDGLCFAKQKRTFPRTGEVQEGLDSDSRCIYDMLSILAQARSFDPADYKVDQKIKFPMSTGTKVEEQTLIYRGKENVKAENGVTYRCLIFSLVEYKDGKEKEVITFFVSDDKNHLPVRLDLFLNFGSAKAFLTNVQGNRHPLTSIVK